MDSSILRSSSNVLKLLVGVYRICGCSVGVCSVWWVGRVGLKGVGVSQMVARIGSKNSIQVLSEPSS